MKPFSFSTCHKIVVTVCSIWFLIVSCSKKINDPVPASDKAILSFTIIKANGVVLDTSDITVNYSNDSIFINVAPGTDLTSLTPQITIKGVSIEPNSGVEQNFTNPVVYTVTAADGTTRNYVVSVSWWQGINNLVFVGSSNNSFYALDALTGAMYWKYTATKSFSYSSPTVFNGTVYAGCIDGNMYAFDAASGTVLWKFPTGLSIESSPAVANGIVYFGSDDDYFYAVDALTGVLKWKYKTGYNVASSPAVVNGIVYVGSDDNNIYAFDALTGIVKWTFASYQLFNQSSPLVSNGTVYIGSRDSYLYAVDEFTGTLRWRFYADGISLEQSSPTISGNTVYIAGWYDFADFSRRGSLYAVDAQTGLLVYKTLEGLAPSYSPLIDEGSLYISCDDLNFYSLNAATGSVNWSKQILPNGSCPTIADGIVYVGGGGTGYIYALNKKTGNELWKFPVPGGLSTSSPCVIGTDGTVYHPGISGEAN